jgi:hypothetical protein
MTKRLNFRAIGWLAAATIIASTTASVAQDSVVPSGVSAQTANVANSKSFSNSTSGALAGAVANGGAAYNAGSQSGAAGGTINSVSQGPDLGRAVPNVYSPALAAAGYEVCLGSMSAGGSGGGFGFSLASTMEDRSCQARLNAKTLATLGYAAAAREVMCQDPNIRTAMINAGTPCAPDARVARAGGACRQEFDPLSGWQTVCN